MRFYLGVSGRITGHGHMAICFVWGKNYLCWGTTNGIPNMKEVIPETVGQYTDLTDKNGVKIFEGDIVKRGDRIWIIEYDVKCAQFVMKTFTERGVFFIRSFDLIPSEWCEVIGNIYDNPELLKGGNNNG